MKLKKPKVKKNAKPKSSQRIVTKVEKAEDREYIELLKPPKFSLDFVKLSDGQLGRYKMPPGSNALPPRSNATSPLAQR